MVVEPPGGRRYISMAPRRTKVDFALQVRELADVREQQFRAGSTEGQVAQLVAEEQVGFVQLTQEPIELVLLLSLLQTCDQAGCGKEAFSRNDEHPHE